MASKTSLKTSDFVHLHNHTHYSLLDGLTKVPPLIEKTKAAGMAAVAKTDHGTMSGVIEFYKIATEQGVKPIIGMETYVAARGRADRDPSKDKLNYHLILLAMNNQGYQNLMRLSTIANLEGFYYKPRIDRELLEQYGEGLIVLSGCIGGEVGDNLRNDQYDKAKEIASWYKKIFGDRYYLEVQDHGHPDHPHRWDEQQRVNEQLLKLAGELKIEPVLTADAHYLNHADKEAHEILLCVQTGAFLEDEKRMSLSDFDLHVDDPKELIGRWGKSNPELITNSRAIADRCDVEIELGKILIPKFPLPKGQTEKSYLHKLVWQGLAWRYGYAESDEAKKLKSEQAKAKLSKEIAERANYELNVIESMGYNGYFLIVQDFVNWGKDQGIIFGPGRGSAAGSIVSYALKITELDPLKYGLMFERFLNPDRVSMPDIDIDIQDSRRGEVIQYCVDKYGGDRVANIVTFGRMAARNAVRDVARVLQVPYGEADRLAKMIPPPVQGRHIPLTQSVKEDAELKKVYKTEATAKQVFDLAMQLEGTIRSHGVHAAGVVIAPDDIVKFVPLEMAQKGVIATQYPMGPVEELGLLKMDFLGLSNLTIIKNALRIIKKVYGKDIDINNVPLDDPKTFELLQRGDTTGIFQLESAGMKRYLKQLKPTVFDDIIAMGALYRPGPMAEIPRFINGKNNPKNVSYLHDLLKPILQETHGVMVYQEQIIRLLQKVAGYSPGEADLVRKAIGKKKRDIMAAEEPKFVKGCVEQGLSTSQAETLWAQIQPFADYSFNKAHATCYGFIAYQTAYLKAHYPASFMAALMSSDYDDSDRLAIEIAECKHMGIDVLPPDVNESFLEFAVVDKEKDERPKIRFGMQAIKNVGTAAVEEVLRARQENGHFKTLEDFFSNVNPRIVNRKSIESLIKSGAFDNLADRSVLLHNLETVMAYSTRLNKQAQDGQTDLFGDGGGMVAQSALKLIQPEQLHNNRERLIWERELLGLYLSHHPLDSFADYLSEQTVPLNYLSAEHDNKSVIVGGLIGQVREIITKKGQKMAFVKIEDKHGETEAVIFPGAYQKTLGLWQPDTVVLINGKVSAKNNDGTSGEEVKILVDDAHEITLEQAENYVLTGKKIKPPKSKAVPIASVQAAQPKRVYLRLSDSEDHELLLNIKRAIDERAGSHEVVLVMGENGSRQAIRLPGGISANTESLGQLGSLVGADNVKFQ